MDGSRLVYFAGKKINLSFLWSLVLFLPFLVFFLLFNIVVNFHSFLKLLDFFLCLLFFLSTIKRVGTWFYFREQNGDQTSSSKGRTLIVYNPLADIENSHITFYRKRPNG
jgi:hypothetical protein